MKDIKILGSHCAKCVQLFNNAKTAADEMKIEYQIEKITDIQKITEYGVMMIPALVIDGEVKSVGKTLSVEEIKKYLA